MILLCNNVIKASFSFNNFKSRTFFSRDESQSDDRPCGRTSYPKSAPLPSPLLSFFSPLFTVSVSSSFPHLPHTQTHTCLKTIMTGFITDYITHTVLYYTNYSLQSIGKENSVGF